MPESEKAAAATTYDDSRRGGAGAGAGGNTGGGYAGGRRGLPDHIPTSVGDFRQFIKDYHVSVAALSSSCVSTFTAFPLDSVKTRMQAYKFRSFYDCVKQTYQTEGVKGFWRGSIAPLASISLVRTVSFTIFSTTDTFYSKLLTRAFGPHAVTPRGESRSGSLPKPGDALRWALAGGTSGAVITVIACPFEFTKLSTQIEYLMARASKASVDDPTITRVKYEAKGTRAAAKYIIQQRGFKGLYSGFHLHLARDTLGTAIYFTTYETAKQLLSTGTTGAGPFAIAAAGGLCGLTSWSMIYPVDSLKAIYQRDVLTHAPGQPLPKRRLQFFNRRMYRGLGVSIFRSAMLNAVFFSTYEYLKKHIAEL